MEKCKTCIYWEDGNCDLVNVNQQSPQTRFEIEVTVADDYNLEYKLLTGPDFGCLLHKPKGN